MRECTDLTEDNKENEVAGWRWFDWVRRENFLAEQNGTKRNADRVRHRGVIVMKKGRHDS
jgi:hypothetical protein